jgi:predicted phage-related endonuclease
VAITSEQRDARRLGIGGSDAAAVASLGLPLDKCFSKYSSPLDIYNDKIYGRIEENSPQMERGNKLEPIIIERFKQITGFDVEVINETLIHHEYDFIRAHIDGLIPSCNALLEAKSVNIWSHAAKEFGEEGTDQIPTEYVFQCAHYCEVFKKTEIFIPVAFVDNDEGTVESIKRFAIYKYQHNPRFGEILIGKEVYFWQEYVIKKIPPPGDSLRALRKGNNLPIITRTALPSTLPVLEEVNALKKEIKKLEDQYKNSIKQLCDFMGDADTLLDLQGNQLATYKTQISNRFDIDKFKKDHLDIYMQYQKTSNFRVFRLKDYDIKEGEKQ